MRSERALRQERSAKIRFCARFGVFFWVRNEVFSNGFVPFLPAAPRFGWRWCGFCAGRRREKWCHPGPQLRCARRVIQKNNDLESNSNLPLRLAVLVIFCAFFGPVCRVGLVGWLKVVTKVWIRYFRLSLLRKCSCGVCPRCSAALKRGKNSIRCLCV